MFYEEANVLTWHLQKAMKWTSNMVLQPHLHHHPCSSSPREQLLLPGDARITSSCWVVPISCSCWAVALNTVQLSTFKLICSHAWFLCPVPGSTAHLTAPPSSASQPLHCPWFNGPAALLSVPCSVLQPRVYFCQSSVLISNHAVNLQSGLAYVTGLQGGWEFLAGHLPNLQMGSAFAASLHPIPLGHYSLCWPLQHFLLPCQPLEHFCPRCHPPGQYHSPAPPSFCWPHPPQGR